MIATILASDASGVETTIRRDGVVRLKNFLPTNTVDEMRWIALSAMRYFADEAGRVQTASTAESFLCRSYDEWTGLCLGWLLEYIEERKIEQLQALSNHVAYAVQSALNVLGGSKFSFLSHSSFFRKVGNHKGGVRWHCDAEAASMLQYGDPCYSIWMPLTPVGEQLPSLEFVLGSHKWMRGRGDLALGNHRTEEWVDQIPSRKAAPVFKDPLGDALLFEMHTLHRTQPMEATEPRLSCELRFNRR